MWCSFGNLRGTGADDPRRGTKGHEGGGHNLVYLPQRTQGNAEDLYQKPCSATLCALCAAICNLQSAIGDRGRGGMIREGERRRQETRRPGDKEIRRQGDKERCRG